MIIDSWGVSQYIPSFLILAFASTAASSNIFFKFVENGTGLTPITI
jgi:hypothetical protein